MKILIVNTQDISGGAARAAYRLHRALLKEGVDSSMLVQKKSSDDFTVLSKSGKVQRALSSLRPTLDILPTYFYKNRDRTLFSPAWLPFSFIVDEINKLNPDIVHLHWICGGLMKIEDIAKIKAPIVWSLHDNWAFTGGCHIMWECEKYKNRCGVCPRLGSSKERDLSRRVFERKEKSFSKIKSLTVVGLSRWLYEASKSSRLLKDKEHVYLPNLIDTTLYKPFDKEKARELWNLPKDKKLILFGAISAMSDINKGFKELYEALQLLSTKNIELVIFGSSKPKNPPKFPFHTHYLGHIHDDVSLVTLYSSVDVMVVPSLQENLSNAIMEALSCSTPVVSFDVGGNSDMIEHKKNGYLSKPYEPYDLANGIEWVLEAPNYKELCKNAREKVLKEFDSKVVAKMYIELYQEVLNEKQ
jgi:glycosyltransferase involved in cell wall biosynthesis